MTDTITVKAAYKAMYLYLEKLYEMTGSQDLAGFLGSMSMMEDDRPVDDAAWEDWLDVVEKSKSNPDIRLHLKE